MAREDSDKRLWDQLPRTELINIILQQQLRLETLQAVLHRLEQQRTGEEINNSPRSQIRCPVNYLLSLQVRQDNDNFPCPSSCQAAFPPICAQIMRGLEMRQEVKQISYLSLTKQHPKIVSATRNALRFLNDPGYLNHSRLIQVLEEVRQIKVDGRSLQRMLNQAIEQLNPCPGQPGYDKRRIRYNILCLAYREQQSPQAIAAALGLSERQYYRELKGAIEEIIEYF